MDEINFQIDAANIWRYEFNELKQTGDPLLYDKLRTIIEPFISSANKPFLKDNKRKDNWAAKYKRDYAKRYKARSIDYFEFDGDYYSYDDSCVVALEENNLKEFSFLFALKLRQFRDDLVTLDRFLYHQLNVNFKSNLKRFVNFIRSLLIQFPELLDERFEKKLNLWEANFDPHQIPDSKDEWFWYSDEMWESVELSLTKDQVRAYFSFLYLERNNKGLPYLEKGDVDKLFKFGFKIPPVPLTRKFKLNLTAQHRKAIIEHCVYRFFERYSGSLKNKQPFLKFLAYTIEDFAAVQNSTQFKNWGKNFTSSTFFSPLPFDIDRYYRKAKAA